MASEKKTKWIYWAVTVLLILAMMPSGLALLAGVPANVEAITRLSYPAYFCKILGTAKLLGGVAILYGRFRTLKEWAYAGYTFNLLAAAASHVFFGDSFAKTLLPVIILVFVLGSYLLWKRALGVKESSTSQVSAPYIARRLSTGKA
jgi:uncharacterized membrane protein YphA (DoxX/SURF4 family)